VDKLLRSEKSNLTEGGILYKLLFVALPIMGTQFMQMAYNLTDMFWLSRLGSDAVAASGAAGMYMWLSFGFLLLGRMGAEIGVAQSLGRADRNGAQGFSRNALWIGLVLGTAFALVMLFFKRELAGFFNFKEQHVAEATADYISVVAIAMPVTFVSSVIVGTFNASGDSRTPFMLNGLGLLANVILDPLFILVLDRGIRGAAEATVISQLIVGAGMIWAITRFKGRPFERYAFFIRPDMGKIRMIFTWALPIGLENIFFCFLAMLASRREASFGAHAMAVSKVGSQRESLSWLIGGGFGSAIVAFVGQNYGAEKRDRIRRGMRASALLMTVWGLLVTVFLWTGGRYVFALFLPDPELLALGVSYLHIFALCQLSMNLEAVASGGFKGKGRTIPPSVASISSNVLRVILAYLLSRTSLGLYGVWIGITISANVRGLWICLWYVFSERKHRR
jgi:putative MATE family efflux protein